ncbi:predicted protein [Uncinocarpus reesii 1704]|uniref:LYR motif-containing protein Cup1-like N-terminal domain-containing protein n=1 Tax=Uncinocarpus reesii (strain UAMH 1704) TaxID=336963 RepID=C4JX81_UNCRE|nr:uncharacterized protein UREG_06254 [Uncinocarpus reesii 1704]EEP81389.1 predicted protein [Uncinocarpus reesii 1704]
MAVPAVLSTRSTPWRHLYRSLVRECTYLPDPVAMDYMRDYVRSSFRENISEARIRGITQIKEFHLHRRGRKLLSLLHRANEGYLKALEKVLLLAYGRIGKRRYFLMRPLLPPQTVIQTFDDNWQPPSALMTLLKSQSNQRTVTELGMRPVIKSFEPPIPKENIWGRPIPYKRRVNIRRRWYRLLIDSCLPILPGQDWGVLHDLATGKGPWTLPKRRKTLAVSQPTTFLTPEFLVHGPAKGPTFEMYSRGRPHNITRRLMEKLWRKVCALTPTMVWDEPRDRWAIQWGMIDAPRRISAHKLDREKGIALFEGVDPRTGQTSHVNRAAG